MTKGKEYFIRCIYVSTSNPQINVSRVFVRTQPRGHDVPKDKILSRYDKALNLVPELLEVCDVCHIYDNSDVPHRIFKKRKTEYFYWENSFDKLNFLLSEENKKKVVGITHIVPDSRKKAGNT